MALHFAEHDVVDLDLNRVDRFYSAKLARLDLAAHRLAARPELDRLAFPQPCDVPCRPTHLAMLSMIRESRRSPTQESRGPIGQSCRYLGEDLVGPDDDYYSLAQLLRHASIGRWGQRQFDAAMSSASAIPFDTRKSLAP